MVENLPLPVADTIVEVAGRVTDAISRVERFFSPPRPRMADSERARESFLPMSPSANQQYINERPTQEAYYEFTNLTTGKRKPQLVVQPAVRIGDLGPPERVLFQPSRNAQNIDGSPKRKPKPSGVLQVQDPDRALREFQNSMGYTELQLVPSGGNRTYLPKVYPGLTRDNEFYTPVQEGITQFRVGDFNDAFSAAAEAFGNSRGYRTGDSLAAGIAPFSLLNDASLGVLSGAVAAETRKAEAYQASQPRINTRSMTKSAAISANTAPRRTIRKRKAK